MAPKHKTLNLNPRGLSHFPEVRLHKAFLSGLATIVN